MGGPYHPLLPHTQKLTGIVPLYSNIQNYKPIPNIFRIYKYVVRPYHMYFIQTPLRLHVAPSNQQGLHKIHIIRPNYLHLQERFRICRSFYSLRYTPNCELWICHKILLVRTSYKGNQTDSGSELQYDLGGSHEITFRQF